MSLQMPEAQHAVSEAKCLALPSLPRGRTDAVRVYRTEKSRIYKFKVRSRRRRELLTGFMAQGLPPKPACGLLIIDPVHGKTRHKTICA